MCEQYIVGCGDVPRWCENKLMPYLKLDGSVGFLFRGNRRDFELNKGDVLIRDGKTINVKRKAVQ